MSDCTPDMTWIELAAWSTLGAEVGVGAGFGGAHPQTSLQLWGRGLRGCKNINVPAVIAPKNGNFFEFSLDRMKF